MSIKINHIKIIFHRMLAPVRARPVDLPGHHPVYLKAMDEEIRRGLFFGMARLKTVVKTNGLAALDKRVKNDAGFNLACVTVKKNRLIGASDIKVSVLSVEMPKQLGW